MADMFFGKGQFNGRRRKNLFMGDGGSSNFDYGKGVRQLLAEAEAISFGSTLAVTGAVTAASSLTVTGQVIGTGMDQLLGKLIGANMNVTTDQAIPITRIGSQKYIITKIVVTNASTSLTAADGGIYTTTSKGGTAIVAAAQVYTALTAATVALDLTLAVNNTYTLDNLYFSLTGTQGGAATADIYVFGIVLPA
jgi:hypothetical protein